MSDVETTSPTTATPAVNNSNNNSSNSNNSTNKLPFDIKFDESLNKNEKINQMLQNIFENLQELKNKMIVNKEKNTEFFKLGNEIIKKSEEKKQQQQQQQQQQSPNNILESPIINDNINDNSNNVKSQSTENINNNDNSNNSVNIEIQKYRDEIKSLREILINKEHEIKDRDTEISDLSFQTEQLKKIIFRLEKEKDYIESSNSETIASISGLVEKGRLQMKSLQSEKSKSEQYLKQFNQEREANLHIRKENQLLKQRVSEMFFLLQKAAEEDEGYYQSYSNETFIENQLLRDLLDSSQNIKIKLNNINNNSNNNNNDNINNLDNNNNSDEQNNNHNHNGIDSNNNKE